MPTALFTITTALLALLLATTMTMPGFLARLVRPFTSASTMGVTSETGAGAATAQIPDGAHKATVAAGCFWGVEHIYRKHFDGKGLYDARVGYIGGDVKNPDYRSVCSGSTGRELHCVLVWWRNTASKFGLTSLCFKMPRPRRSFTTRLRLRTRS